MLLLVLLSFITLPSIAEVEVLSAEQVEDSEIFINHIACDQLGVPLDEAVLGDTIQLIDEIANVDRAAFNSLFNYRYQVYDFAQRILNIHPDQISNAPFILLHALSTLADDSDEPIFIDMVDVRSIIQNVSQVLGERMPPHVSIFLETLSQIDKVEISKVKRGKFSGENRIRIHTMNDDPARVDLRQYMNNAPESVANFEIKNKAELIFHDAPEDSRGRTRDSRIVDLLEDVRTEENGQPNYSESQKNNAISFIENESYQRFNQPIYFQAKGFKATSTSPVLSTLGVGVKLSSGVLLPNLETETGSRSDPSLFLKFKGTGFFGAAGLIKRTVAI